MAKAEGVETPKRKSGKWGWIVVAGIIGVAWLGATNPTEQTVPLTAEQKADQEAAKVAAFYKDCTLSRYGSEAFALMTAYIKPRLNDAGSAKFPYRDEYIRIDQSTCTFHIAGEFSAKNGFGGHVRGDYDAELRRTPKGKWIPVSVNVN